VSPPAPSAYLGLLGADFTIDGSPELAGALRTLIARYQRALDNSAYAPG
jgi:hypothetical protein